MTNCINCGAPLHGNCQYCGTLYQKPTDGSIWIADADCDDLTATGAMLQAQQNQAELNRLMMNCPTTQLAHAYGMGHAPWEDNLRQFMIMAAQATKFV